jgi:hypothetical protein
MILFMKYNQCVVWKIGLLRKIKDEDFCKNPHKHTKACRHTYTACLMLRVCTVVD